MQINYEVNHVIILPDKTLFRSYCFLFISFIWSFSKAFFLYLLSFLFYSDEICKNKTQGVDQYTCMCVSEEHRPIMLLLFFLWFFQSVCVRSKIIWHHEGVIHSIIVKIRFFLLLWKNCIKTNNLLYLFPDIFGKSGFEQLPEWVRNSI